MSRKTLKVSKANSKTENQEVKAKAKIKLIIRSSALMLIRTDNEILLEILIVSFIPYKMQVIHHLQERCNFLRLQPLLSSGASPCNFNETMFIFFVYLVFIIFTVITETA